MVYVPQISMAETPEMMLGLVLAVSAPIAFVMEIFGYVYTFCDRQGDRKLTVHSLLQSEPGVFQICGGDGQDDGHPFSVGHVHAVFSGSE